jgi:CubicO group peptidase (beta-lactamase class C family)
MRPISIVTLALLAAATRAAAQPSVTVHPSPGAAVEFPASPAGRLATALITAINSGDSAQVRRWADTSFTAAALARAPLAEHVAELLTLQRESGGLDVISIRPGEPLRWTAKARRTGRYLGMLLGGGATAPRAEGVGTYPMPAPSEPWPEGTLSADAIRAAIGAHASAASGRDDFSGVVRVLRGDTVFFEAAYGEAEKSFHVANNLETRFNIASMGKMFTAVAIAQLVEAGKLRFEDTLANVLPEYPNREAARKITIHQLLTHSAGLGGFFDRPAYDRRKDYPTAASLLDVFAREPLAYEPGTGSAYSNEGFVVLGAVIEKVSGENYYDYIRRHVYAPAGMAHTDAYAIDDPVENLAVGYGWFDDDPLGSRPRRPNWAFLGLRGTPCGGFYSTAGDMLRFERALRSGALVSPAMVQRLTTAQNGLPQYGYGFQVRDVNGRTMLGHDGGGASSGINSDLYWFRDGSWSVAVMGNYDAPSAQRLATSIMDFLSKQ